MFIRFCESYLALLASAPIGFGIVTAKQISIISHLNKLNDIAFDEFSSGEQKL